MTKGVLPEVHSVTVVSLTLCGKKNMKIAAIVYEKGGKPQIFEGIWDALDSDELGEAEAIAEDIGGKVAIMDVSLSETLLEALIHPSCDLLHLQGERIPAPQPECPLCRQN